MGHSVNHSRYNVHKYEDMDKQLTERVRRKKVDNKALCLIKKTTVTHLYFLFFYRLK